VSAALLGLAWQAKVGDSKTRKLVLMKLVDEGSNIYPALATVADHVGCSTQQVRRTLKDFGGVGLLRKVRDGGRGAGSTARYELDIDMLARLRRAEMWPALEAAAARDPLPDSDDDEASGHAPNASSEASDAPAAASNKGDMVSPLHGVSLTPAIDKGDIWSHPTPHRPLSSERESAGAGAGAPAGSGDAPDAGHAADAEPPATLAAFLASYPHASADDQVTLASAWEGVPFAERRAAIDGIPGFVAERKAAGFDKRLSGPKYLSGRNWRHVPKLAAERAAAQAAGASGMISGYSRDWWLLLLDRIFAGKSPGFWMQQAEARKLLSASGADLAAAAKRIGELHAYLCDGPEIEAWRPWLAARGARIPAFRGDFRVFLPKPLPPGGRADQGDDDVAF
jgi:hypothetical protein